MNTEGGRIIAEQLTAVLIVDDDEDFCASVRRFLKRDGHRVDIANTATEALDRHNWSDYFAILVDRRLPDGSEEDLLPQLKQLAPHASLVVITGHADIDSVIVGVRLGAEDYLTKPIEPDALRAWVRRTAELKQTQLKLQESEKRARQAERLAAVGQMLTAVSHESRNALQRGLACLEMLR
ncbi:Alginate biosynthesis transcriptional regulatory protein AlgB [Bremerella volcania]|uniref:Alginate biosynthesis transcriptional regulatory protein AlgB n=1 Tax=Bremerella volcania TaxID=2527984 RepID=A0A518C5U3_9BACT|nr:response regulator [Bremerella volcania]QDU74596.1 Alginate biosynthesis transcriptional regulatory protein AlgB [Bremerella volcania]